MVLTERCNAILNECGQSTSLRDLVYALARCPMDQVRTAVRTHASDVGDAFVTEVTLSHGLPTCTAGHSFRFQGVVVGEQGDAPPVGRCTSDRDCHDEKRSFGLKLRSRQLEGINVAR
jgi:hypothetical protein